MAKAKKAAGLDELTTAPKELTLAEVFELEAAAAPTAEPAPVAAPVASFRVPRAVRFHGPMGIMTVAAGSVVSATTHDLAVLRAAGAELEAL